MSFLLSRPPTHSCPLVPYTTLFRSLAADGRAKRPLTIPQLEEWLMLVKGELKEHVAETGELRIELQDSNRPDLWRSEEHTSELQSPCNLVCRLLLERKKESGHIVCI